MLEIKLNRLIVCDNGKKYSLYGADYPYKYRLYNDNWLKSNEVREYYLEDAIKYNQSICVGRNDDKNLEYTRIVDVEKSLWELREDMLQEHLQYMKDLNMRHEESRRKIN